MSILTQAIYDKLAADATLTGLLADYNGSPAIFTTDPAPGDAALPYIVTAGEVSMVALDSKTSRGRDLIRDVRCYAEADGSTVTIETIAERVRTLLHRQNLAVAGYNWIVSDCTGPIEADELDAYGRIVSVRLHIQDIFEPAYIPPSPVVLGTMAGVDDAPSDGNIYGRQNGAWAVAGGAVDSVFGRTGVVVALAGDYTASQVTNVPAGGIAAVTVQAALNELDSEKQPLDTFLTSIAGLGTAADKMIYTTGLDAAAETDLTAFARTMLDDANAAAVRATIGAGTTTLPVVDETAIVYETGVPANTLTFDVTPFTAARIVTWPDAAMTVAGLEVANVFTAAQTVKVDTATNNATLTVATLGANVTGAAHATTGFGPNLLFTAEDDTSVDQDSGQITFLWIDAAHAAVSSAFRVYLRRNGAALAPFLILDSDLDNYFVGRAGNLTATGVQNVALGAATLPLLSTGQNNVALGTTALSNNSTGSYNMALGNQTLLVNSSGNSNVAIADRAGVGNTTGNTNVYIGIFSGRYQQTGSDNLFLGGRSGQGTGNYSVSNTICINPNAVAATVNPASNRLYIDNGDIATSLIYGEFDNDFIRIGGRLESKSYSETLNNIGDFGGGAQAIDTKLGNVVAATVSTGAVTFTFTNPPASGYGVSFTLILTNGGSQTVNWPASVDWASGIAPSLTVAGVDVLTFFTVDGGTIWYGFVAGLDMQ